MGKRKLVSDEVVSGPSSSSQSQPQVDAQTSLPRKKPRKDTTSPEKRGAVFKKSCPKNILDRVARVMSQRRREGDKLCEEFKVLGSTGNVYTVIIASSPSCNCPDASRGNHCKHILFIFLKVLQVPQSSNLWYQKALLTSELRIIFADAPQAPNALAHDKVRDAYARAAGQAPTSAPSGSKKRIPTPEDSCPICYEDMHGISQDKLVFCEECGNALHTECFKQWRRSAATLTCVWCRAKWPMGIKDGTGPSSTSGGYINLGSVAGLSGERDTSSYHQSWRY